MPNIYPTYMHYQYRVYPDVQLIHFAITSQDDKVAEEQDNRDVLILMEQVITKRSDVAPFLEFASNVTDPRGEGDDFLLIQLGLIQRTLAGNYDGYINLPGLRDRAVDMRHEGAETIPRNLMKLLHADLAKKEAMAKVLEDLPVDMGERRHAGKKARRIMVMRFVKRKLEVLDAIGEFVAEESTDDETRVTGNKDARRVVWIYEYRSATRSIVTVEE
ncbi:uncharacterized protein ALTATR162_LOCUS2381 [Alternaria atra]|uniref:Uncharacterized protein n=1 Tax=Alternaria atra TaxID=119953 RepID=A0A8J2HZ15_9PLEO|nr:uncharacterized protein ALTATR162_LOCUS2381 [Alternaria atra]CAG5149496.1 unnamed protein product [Alternaria atra]